MSKVIKDISVLFLWIACLSVCAHLIIPHDHHVNILNECTRDDRPCSEGKSNHGSGFPLHCHAFNDLPSEKHISFDFIKKIQYNYTSINDFPEGSAFRFSTFCGTISEFGKPYHNDFQLELALLRAPPSLI